MDGTTPSRAEPVVGKYGCTGKNRLGRPCNARVIRGRDVCVRHSMSDEEWHAQAKRGGRTRWDNERAGRRLEEIQHAQLKARFAEELVAALDAKIPGTAEPDHDRVQTALYVIAQNFRFTRADLEGVGLSAPAQAPRRATLIPPSRRRGSTSPTAGRLRVRPLPPPSRLHPDVRAGLS
jgi:hypothetical protein